VSLVTTRGLTPLFVTSYTMDCIRNALPVIPFTFRNKRVQSFEQLLFPGHGDHLFKAGALTVLRCLPVEYQMPNSLASTNVSINPEQTMTNSRLRTAITATKQLSQIWPEQTDERNSGRVIRSCFTPKFLPTREPKPGEH